MTVQNDIDKIFKNGLADYTEQPPTYNWNNIEQVLSEKDKRKKRQFIWAIAASIALLISFGTGYKFTHTKATGFFTESHPKTTLINETTSPKNSALKNNITIEEPVHQSKNEFKQETTPTSGKSVIPKKNNQTEDPRLNNDSPTAKPEKPTQHQQKVIPASSEGMLLPPLFGDNENYNSINNIVVNNTQANSTEDQLYTIKPQKEDLVYIEPEKDIVYLIKLLPLIDEEENPKQTNEKEEYAWGVGLSGTPLYSYRTINNTNDNVEYATATGTSGSDEDYSNEKALISYAAGINVNYCLNKRWSIQSGIYYSELGQTSENFTYNELASNYDEITSENQLVINTSNGNIVAGVSFALSNNYFDDAIATSNNTDDVVTSYASSESASFILTYEYYEVPLIIQYKMIDRKISLSLSGGLSTNFLTGNTTYLKNGSSKEDIDGSVEGIKPMSYTSVFGLGLEYPLITQLYINLNPSFRYSINSLNEAGTVHPYSFGIFTGLKYKF